MINTEKFFSIEYLKISTGEVEKYICRSGVTEWKELDGTINAVKGTGRPTAQGYVKLYCANRKGYRQFLIENIQSVKQLDNEFDLSVFEKPTVI